MVTQQVSALGSTSFPGCLSHPRGVNPWQQPDEGPCSAAQHQPGVACCRPLLAIRIRPSVRNLLIQKKMGWPINQPKQILELLTRRAPAQGSLGRTGDLREEIHDAGGLILPHKTSLAHNPMENIQLSEGSCSNPVALLSGQLVSREHPRR